MTSPMRPNNISQSLQGNYDSAYEDQIYCSHEDQILPLHLPIQHTSQQTQMKQVHYHHHCHPYEAFDKMNHHENQFLENFQQTAFTNDHSQGWPYLEQWQNLPSSQMYLNSSRQSQEYKSFNSQEQYQQLKGSHTYFQDIESHSSYRKRQFQQQIPFPQLTKQHQSCNLQQYPINLKSEQHKFCDQYQMPEFIQPKVEQPTKKGSVNYYQIFLDYERQQKEEEEITRKLSTSSTTFDDHLTQKKSYEMDSCLSPSMTSTISAEREQRIKNSNKKNVVKNIMSAFKNFILETEEHFYNSADLQIVLDIYNSTKKGLDDLSEMKMKFKRYINSKNFNHYTVKLLITHINYSGVFKHFLSGPVHDWIKNSKISDIQSHVIMIDYLKDCFEDISFIDVLKKHEKKRAHFQ